MAVVTNTSKNALGQINPTAIMLATSGDTLTYTSGANQELHLFNTDVAPIVVTIDGAGGTTVAIPGAGGATASVASGLDITVAAGAPAVVRLDTVYSYLVGSVSIVAATGAKVAAYIVQ